MAEELKTSAPSKRRPDEQLIATPEELAACCAYLASCPQIGFDTEFVGEDTYHPRLCLVQVATPERLLLIDPVSAGPLDAFWKLIVDPARLVVVHAGREEVRLCCLWAGQPPGNLCDVQIAAGLIGMTYPLGHGALVNQLLRVQLSKGETLTEWRERPLTAEQIKYAYDDVRYLLPLWQKIHQRLRHLDRKDWAREEFARLQVNAMASPEATEKFRKLRRPRRLDRRRLAIVRELYMWRGEGGAEQSAAADARARRFAGGDRPPQSDQKRDLEVVRGLGHRDLGAIVEAVARAAPCRWSNARRRRSASRIRRKSA